MSTAFCQISSCSTYVVLQDPPSLSLLSQYRDGEKNSNSPNFPFSQLRIMQKKVDENIDGKKRQYEERGYHFLYIFLLAWAYECGAINMLFPLCSSSHTMNPRDRDWPLNEYKAYLQKIFSCPSASK